MKKTVLGLFLFLSLILCGLKVNAVSFSEAVNQSKPSAILIYADWADDYQNVYNAFETVSQTFGDRYNFVTINIADKEAKEFNKTFNIYPNLPYVLLFRDKGKMSRYLKKDCVLNTSCFTEKLTFFIN